MKIQLSFVKEQKNSYKISEKNLREKLDLKEKEINDLRTILNTNISIKSQLSSINHDWKDEENSKEIKEILPYNDALYVNKKSNRFKSLSLIEKKLSYYNSSANVRNSLQNNSNKSYNSKNISKHKIKKIKNVNNPKNTNKYKTVANLFSGSNTKRRKEDSSIKIINNLIKPYIYSNYNSNSLNSFRGKRLDKSDSRSLISRRVISKSKINAHEESNNSKYFLINFNNINSYNNKKEKESIHSNKDKIMINYNTNIINTNVSIDKLTIKQKMRDYGKDIDDKITDITRNKKHSFKRTISEIYDKRSKSPFLNEKLKIKTKRKPSLRYKEKYYNLNKLIIKSRKKFKINNENSNFFRQKLQILTIQHKNINSKKNKKVKIKFNNKNNSLINIKNGVNKNNKKFKIQGYIGKKFNGNGQLLKKNNKRMKIAKNISVINLSNNIQMKIGKSKNLDNNYKTIINNSHNMTYRKSTNYDKITIFNERSNKYESKIKKKNIDINCIKNNNINKSNSSLRKYIFNKCISGPNEN